MSDLPLNPSASFKRRNPDLYSGVETPKAQSPVPDAPRHCQGDRAAIKRIRQGGNPLLNKLEQQWLTVLTYRYPYAKIRAQAWRVKIANGAWFKVDFCAMVDGRWTAWEVKGPKQGKNVDRGMLALKCAASAYPEIQWILVWYDKHFCEWHEQILEP